MIPLRNHFLYGRVLHIQFIPVISYQVNNMSNDVEKFIKANANRTSIQRSKNYTTKLVEKSEQLAIFSCRGSAYQPYIISIKLKNGDLSGVSCTCPYDAGGICKHSVAALRAYHKLTLQDAAETFTLEAPQIKNQTKKTSKRKSSRVDKSLLTYPLDAEGHFDIEAIKRDFERKRIFVAPYFINEGTQITDFIEAKQITTQTRSYDGVHSQTFIQDNHNKTLSMSCNCKNRKKPYCDHLFMGIVRIYKTFQSNCLTENYLNDLKAEFLQNYQLTLEDDYQKFFTFALTNTGLTVERLQPNLQPISITPVANLTNIPLHYAKKMTSNQKSVQKGMGLVFEYYGRIYEAFSCVEAKKNKQGELATTFKVLEEHNAEGVLYSGLYGNDERDIYFQSRLINNCLQENQGGISADELMLSIRNFNELCDKLTSFPLFTHQYDNTYTRKNLTAITINCTEKISLLFQLTDDEHCYHLTAKIKIGNKALQANSNLLKISPIFILKGDEVFPITTAQLAADILNYSHTPKQSFLKSNPQAFFENILQPLSNLYEIQGKTLKASKTGKKATQHAKQIHHSEKVASKKADSHKDNTQTTGKQITSKQTANTATNPKSAKIDSSSVASIEVEAIDTTEANATGLTTQPNNPDVSTALSHPSPKQPECQVYVNEQDGLVFFRLAVQYPDKLIDAHSQALRMSMDADGNLSVMERDDGLEQAFISQFEGLHEDFSKYDTAESAGMYILTPEQLIDNFWFIETAHYLQAHDIKLLGIKNLASFKYNLNKPSVNVSVKSDIDWFDVHMTVAFGDQHVSLKDLQKAFVKKKNYVELKDGSIGMLPEQWMQKYEQYFKAGDVKKDHIQISNFQFGIIDELYDSLENKPEFLTELYERKQRLSQLSQQKDVTKPKAVKAKLRPYQQQGLNWLSFLHENRLGGCLADDMGLGKTLQTITFLQHVKEQAQATVTSQTKSKKHRKTSCPTISTTTSSTATSLIVAPTSLIFNWQSEINKFCPSLSVLNFTGAGRMQQLDKLTEHDVVITTYGSVVNDIETLKDIEFNYVILDESQAIKNPLSQRYKAVRLLKAFNRLILTGTPIENNTFDLYAQFNFINPGLLGNTSHFRKTFSDAIDKSKDVATSELLSKLVSPFILRRTKEQVATELPPKIESVMYCEMGTKQRRVYEAMKQQYRDSLMNTINENGIEKSQMYILEGLMKLRQICNSPAILSDDADYGDESVKLDMLLDNIKEKTGKHKILVFSTFVKMLKLIQTRLNKENIPCEYLDGKTRNRQKKVDNFQNNADVRVFLISTKAGGTGLNLTEADYVFIVDPWWNPAVENQAIDRSYRIGQTKHVMAYRMICKDSIEEKILALQQSKKSVADSVISVDEEKKSFDVAAVKDLFG